MVMLAFAGLPIFFMEIVLGQYTGVGPVKIFGRMAPLLRGLGYVSIKLSNHHALNVPFKDIFHSKL